MARQRIAKLLAASGIIVIIIAFFNIVSLIHSYNENVQNQSSHIISAFDG